MKGHNNTESVIQAIITGSPERLPASYRNGNEKPLTQREKQLLDATNAALAEVMNLSQLAPAPVPISEFCARPENINLKSLCK